MSAPAGAKAAVSLPTTYTGRMKDLMRKYGRVALGVHFTVYFTCLAGEGRGARCPLRNLHRAGGRASAPAREAQGRWVLGGAGSASDASAAPPLIVWVAARGLARTPAPVRVRPPP